MPSRQINDFFTKRTQKRIELVSRPESLQSPALVDKLIQKCITILDFLRSLEARVSKCGEQVSQVVTADYPISDKVAETHASMTRCGH